VEALAPLATAKAPLAELRKAIERRERFIEMNGEKVRSLRKAQGLYKKDLARLANVTQPTLRRAEQSRRVYPATARKLGKALGVDPRSLGQRSSKPVE
jgi:DNA-binding transcriptional regulator YiaG